MNPRRREFARVLALASLLPLASCQRSGGALPVVASSQVQRLAELSSRHVDARPIDVWLPPGYDGRGRHPVVYLHDGQAMFDGAEAMSKTGWQMDRAVARLGLARAQERPILVAIWSHRSRRHIEFFPQPMLDRLSKEARERAWQQLPILARPFAGDLVREGRSASDAYLRFIVEEVKPLVDQRFATLADPANTFLMGSSMGGLISIHGLLRYPNVFGAAAALSTHWVGLFQRNDEISDAALAWLREALPAQAGRLRLYLDRGTIEMDAEYSHAQGQVDALLRERGFREPAVVSRVIPGAGHNERDWGARAHQALSFLLRDRAVSTL